MSKYIFNLTAVIAGFPQTALQSQHAFLARVRV
jgi:hypothetical protein